MSARLDLPAARQVVTRTRRTTHRRTRLVVAGLVVLVAALFLVEVLLGTFTVTLPDLLRIVGGADLPGATFVVLEDKLPRAVTGLLVGAAFGVSGAVFQTMLRNPLASPDVIGVTAGASAGAVLAIVVLGASGPALSAWSFGGTLVVALAIHLLARGGGARMVLVGIGLAAMLQSVVSYLLTRSDVRVASDAFVWLTGSLNGSTWPRVRDLVVALAVLLPLAVLLARFLDVLALGDDPAAGLGVPVARARLALLVVGVALAAVATAAAGPVAFVAFVSGPIARRLLRGRVSLVAAGLVGAAVVLAADFVAHNLVPGATLPVGVVTGALGAPFLLALIVASNRRTA
ncbi:iron chelate uptake ABC transporter family permease subunit [Nocardioides panacis]|uniref:Iron chelate uptake ABC transporter family permease subunit n=1 Tax=Nocardioides panacis TaxID=2849501 RepID=A0A975SWD8_9ACTN|nr:iron chelate uptake ABC transporter family permease subunit [Nocardioides panacis]QWZ07051.1 iron chelate uptake ABC transporter family permease subunit [Nocardioides panacis]